MTKVLSGNYVIEIISNPGEQPYDHLYADGDYYSQPILLRTYQSEHILKTVLINSDGGGTFVSGTSFIVQENKITICGSDSIFSLSIPELKLLWRTKADTVTCFEIFPYKHDYIVHGELEISRLDSNGKILWQQSGADIFISLNSSGDDFLVTDDYILATDWNGKKYKWDFDGNSIK
ncbi:MAG: hypothetical protein ACTHJ8_09455 [Mucilaginibacter sp.]|jgi:hypothetical protein